MQDWKTRGENAEPVEPQNGKCKPFVFLSCAFSSPATWCRIFQSCIFHFKIKIRKIYAFCQRRRWLNKKSELMFMRRARAYSSFCSQVILAYLHPFCHSSLLCSPKSPKITKNNTFRVQGHSRSSMLTFVKSSSPVLVSCLCLSATIFTLDKPTTHK